ncbi:general odorant-binding protein 19d-like [Homalodisca vitripennis]|nr:general odorant-binding protein 19d-like [Homalodisca vitripennis]KAG8257605.1 pheromone binding [Homalodisca vitripennis]
MRSFAVIVVVLVAVTLSQADLDRQKSIETLKKCKAETGASEDPEHTFDTQTVPESKEGKCMLACVLREKKLLKDGKVSGPAVSNYFEKTYSDNPEKLELAARAVGICSTKEVKGLDECEMAYAYFKCGKENGLKL